ncbi:CAP domain-containing protein [Streptomyces sennicomposti]|uniref:CAP domain-containing protein n=1 Tax=Streptomyces sennicomposti TaxID=2873384 RepID=UPI001CA7A90C|nr:CAP domain-containing protein [Streptomyces sennicomposti]MBY8867554.1 CAP domain-containing protein [Streptomyces sennicomposti]
MGRHRRSDAGRATTDRATGATDTHGSYRQGHSSRDLYDSFPDGDRMGIAPYLNPERYADAYARAEEYLFATDDDYARATDTVGFPPEGFSPSQGPLGRGRRRRRRAATPVRTGLLGVSAAVALGTVAVATGAVPGLENYRLGGDSSTGADSVQAAGTPTNSASAQGGTSGGALPGDRTGAPGAGRGAGRPASPTHSAAQPSATPSPSAPSASQSPAATAPATPAKPPAAEPTTEPAGTAAPQETAPAAPATKIPRQRTRSPATVSTEATAAAEVLSLVNQERAKAGCSPVTADGALASLAEDFSEAMADQGFFDHTDPSGASPWDRAARLGITGLGGENIARGQADAAAVMDAWMNSPGHRANILNCDFKTLGVGVHFGTGGPWWTQDFGY